MDKKLLQIDLQDIAYYESEGKGETVLFIHGNSLSGKCFERQLKSDIAKTFRFVAIDLPGHGESAKADNPKLTYSPDGYINIITKFSNQLGLQNGFFVGWSLGGHILLDASSKLPNAKGFMIYGTPPLGIPPAMDKAFNNLSFNPFQENYTDNEIDTIINSYFKPNASDIPESFKSFVRNTDGQARAMLGLNIMTGQMKNEINIIKNLDVPLAILHGEYEQLVNRSYIEELDIPTMWKDEIQTIPNAGHSIQWENSNKFNSTLKEFIVG